MSYLSEVYRHAALNALPTEKGKLTGNQDTAVAEAAALVAIALELKEIRTLLGNR